MPPRAETGTACEYNPMEAIKTNYFGQQQCD
jgi:FlaA1/EpsC-like NDP-sugar epimerase